MRRGKAGKERLGDKEGGEGGKKGLRADKRKEEERWLSRE